MILLDTGFLIALTDPADALRDRARALLPFVDTRVILHQFVVVEYLNYFSNSRFRKESHRLLDALVAGNAVEMLLVDEPTYARAMKLHRERPDKGWSLTDCISFVLMDQRGIQSALAYDHHFEQAGFEALLRRDP